MATAILLPAPELQFCDADGKPYAGGTIATYVPGTTTPKATWVDPGEAALNTNPIVLDAAGRCIIYGDGNYRLILRDAAGNLIWDQPSSTIVSAAMYPVVSAPTIADAQNLLGITGFATAADLASAISAEQNARIAADTAETNRAEAAEANLQSQIDAINTTLAGMGGSSGLPHFEAGVGVSDSTGVATVTFTTTFTTAPAVVGTILNTALGDEWLAIGYTSTTGFTAYVSQPTGGGSSLGGAPIGFWWIAMGN
jgi:hypothetical protein